MTCTDTSQRVSLATEINWGVLSRTARNSVERFIVAVVIIIIIIIIIIIKLTP
jgi:hypothetical protein